MLFRSLALPPIISRLQGNKNIAGIADASQQAGYLVFFVGVVITALLPFTESIVSLFPMAPELYSITVDYGVYVLLAMPGFALYQWLRNYCEGLGKTKPTMIITVIGLLANVVGNYLFIYGAGSIPAMGGAGCGVATAIVIYTMLIATFVYVRMAPALKQYNLFGKRYTPNLSTINRTFKMGLPIAMTI